MMATASSNDELQGEIVNYYLRGDEARRLLQGYGQLERARTQSLLDRHLPRPPAVILDVGGGSGIYACHLASLGYEVHLIDAVPLHVEQALENSARQPTHPLASARVGDARALERAGESIDTVLLLGPLYHLTEKADRLKALLEVYRVLFPGGMVFAVGISRFASSLQGFARGYLDDPTFAAIAARDLEEGQHRNPTAKKGYFTTAYFHHPGELAEELALAGFTDLKSLAVEGPFWMLQDIDDQWNDRHKQRRLLEFMLKVEEEPSLLGASAHIMVIGQKPG